MSEIQNGYFFITDFSGYTFFLSRSELSHAKEILDTLFDVILEQIQPPLEILTTQGDSVIAYAAQKYFLQPQTLLEEMENIYFEFHRHLELMTANSTCRCKACANMGALDLKVFIHFAY